MTDHTFNEHYQENFKALENFALKLTRDKNRAEELVQIAAIKAYRGRNSFRPGSNFKNWAFTILKNAFISNYRKKKKASVISAPVEEMEYASMSKGTVRNKAISNLNISNIKKCVEEVSYTSKLPLSLYAEGYQYQEISEKLNIPIGTVKSRINFARKKLKVILSDRSIIAA